jgi:mannose-1-phosphate guanylyltransferase
MVLAAGLGTRLRPLTDGCAKPLVPVGDRPALAHVLERLRAAGATRIVVNAHHRAPDVREFVEGQGHGIAVSEEKELLGTAGGVARAAPLLGGGEVLVWNADVLANVNLGGLVAARTADGSAATLVVQLQPKGRGPVGVDARGYVVRLREERFGEEVQGGEFLGVSVLGEMLRARLPERGCLVGDVWLPALRGGATLGTFRHDGPWHDIGSVESYWTANLAWLQASGLAKWVGEGGRVEGGVALEHAIVGKGSHVGGAGAVARCVVWPGATAMAPLADAVVTTERVVVVHR